MQMGMNMITFYRLLCDSKMNKCYLNSFLKPITYFAMQMGMNMITFYRLLCDNKMVDGCGESYYMCILYMKGLLVQWHFSSF